MNWKLVGIGALVFWIVSNIIGMAVTGPIIHQGVLDPVYRAHESFWIEPLRQDPPDMAAVLPYWLINSLLASLVIAGIYSCVHSCFKGPGWRKGLTWGLCLAILTFCTYLAFSGLFALPMTIFIWWGVDAAIIYMISGAAMGWVGGRFAGA